MVSDQPWRTVALLRKAGSRRRRSRTKLILREAATVTAKLVVIPNTPRTPDGPHGSPKPQPISGAPSTEDRPKVWFAFEGALHTSGTWGVGHRCAEAGEQAIFRRIKRSYDWRSRIVSRRRNPTQAACAAPTLTEERAFGEETQPRVSPKPRQFVADRPWSGRELREGDAELTR
jgi:hypothetical protein